MDKHTIHNQEIGVHSRAKDAVSWLKDGLTRHGLERLQKRAEQEGEVHFTDGDGNKFRMKHDEEKGFHVDKRHHS